MQFSIAKKQEISVATKKYLVDNGMSQSDFIRNTKFPSDYLSSILNEKWDKEYPKQEHFEKLCNLIEFEFEKKYWQHFTTDFYERIEGVFMDAKMGKKLCGIDGVTGIGKTYSLERLSRSSNGNFYTKVDISQSGLDFLEKSCESMGIKPSSRNAFNMIKLIVEKLKATKDALWIIDELEYGKKIIIDLIKTINDQIIGTAGILMCGFGIKEFIDKKALSTQGKKGWAQIQRRLNQNWNVLDKIGKGTNGWKKIVSDIVDEIAPKRFSDSAKSWITNRSENFDELKTFVSESLMFADDDAKPIITKKYLEDIFA